MKPTAHSVLIVSLGWLFASFSLPARHVQSSPPQQPIASGVTAVVVDVIVRDSKGNPVTDLRKEDFQLFEDGVQQDVADAVVIMPGRGTSAGPAVTTGRNTSDAAPAAGPVRPRPPGESFLAIVFDRLSPEARGLAYKGALSYLDTLHEGDYAGVFLSDLTLKTIQTYTNDREKIRKAIYDVSTRATSALNRDAIKDNLKDRNDRGELLQGDADPSVPIVASAESVGRPVDGRDIVAREMAAVQQSAWETMARDEQGYATTNALLAITAGLGTLPGRKSVVFFAEALAIPDAVLPHFRNVVTVANRANVSFYTIDSAGLRVHSEDQATKRALAQGGSLRMLEANEDRLRKDPRTSLTLLAQQTGGFLVENTNDLGSAFRQIDSDRRFHYLLTYSPKNTVFSGEWRTISVKVPNRKVSIRARAGYQALRASANALLLAYEAPALAALDRTPAPADLPLRAAALVFPGNQVAVLASTRSEALTFKRDSAGKTYQTDFTILARITDARGAVVRKASQPYRLAGPEQQIEQARRGEVLFFRQPSLDPGTYTLEVAVHDALGSRAGVHRSTFTVPPIVPAALQVSTVVIVQRGERVPAGERQANNPLYFGDAVIYPNLGEPLSKARDKALTFYVVIAPGPGGVPAATLELAREGQVLAQSAVTLPAADASGRIAHVAQVPVDALAPGKYTLRLVVQQGERREIRETGFELIN
jgi:VWFA-related protein